MKDEIKRDSGYIDNIKVLAPKVIKQLANGKKRKIGLAKRIRKNVVVV